MQETAKKVLIITYYWPPSGGSGVQRWLKFVKYLPQQGWQPYVYTPENPAFEMKDESLAKDVPAEAEIIKLPIWEPYVYFQKLSQFFLGKKARSTDFISTGRKSVFQRIAAFIRGNFFIPDPKVYWVRPSVKFLHDFIRGNQIRTIITTGPPHSMHLIGLGLKKRNPQLRWIADFRDPWSEWDMLDTMSLTGIARHSHRRKERKVLLQADCVLTVTPTYVERFRQLSNRPVELITNGFDEDDFPQTNERRKTGKFTIRHAGTIDELRDPRPVIDAMEELCVEFLEFKENTLLEFVGNVNSSLRAEIEARTVLSSVIKFSEPVPHARLMELYPSTDLQLLVLAQFSLASGNIPGKIFEYLASGNPILAVGSTTGDSAAILNQAQAGTTFERTDIKGIKAFLLKCFHAWKSGNRDRAQDVSVFSRKELTKKLVALLDKS